MKVRRLDTRDTDFDAQFAALVSPDTAVDREVARVVASCIHGDLRHTSGEVIYVHKTL